MYRAFRARHIPLITSIPALTLLGVSQTGDSPSKCDSNKVLYKNFVADAADKAAPAVVNLKIEWNLNPLMKGLSSGSGFVVSPKGFIITNAHVVSYGQSVRGGYGSNGSSSKMEKSKVLVTFWNGEKCMGTVHSMDVASDIALVKLDEDSMPNPLPVVTFGESANLRAGEFVIALGSPLTLKNSVTFGIVSSVSRRGTDLGIAKSRQEWIQTDAAINQGNSGGPLINLDGDVIGINSMKVSNSDGISFAIPIDNALVVMKQLMTKGRVIRPYLGFRLEQIPVEPKMGNGKGNDTFLSSEDVRVIITGMDSNSPASSANLKVGDEIVEVDGGKVRDITDILTAVGLEVGRTINFKVKRGNNFFHVSIQTVPEKQHRGA